MSDPFGTPPPPPPQNDFPAERGAVKPVDNGTRLAAFLMALLLHIAVVVASGLVAWLIIRPEDEFDSIEGESGAVDFAGDFWNFGEDLDSVFLLAGVLGLVPMLIWSIASWRKSTTPGKRLLKLQVVDVSTGEPVSMARMVLRTVVGKWVAFFAGNAVFVSLFGDPGSNFFYFYLAASGILILVSPMRQGIWDFLSHTTVVKVD